MRKILIFLLTVMLAVLPLAAAAADYTETNEETGYRLVIEDSGSLLKSGETAKVAEAMQGITQYAHAGFLTVAATGDRSEAYSKARKWGDTTFGQTARYTVFIIDMNTRQLSIYASNPLSGELTTAKENSIVDNIYKLASGEEYGECAVQAFTQIERVLKGQNIPEPMKYLSNAFIAVIGAILAAYLLISAWVRKEQAITMPNVIRAAGIGAATVITANTLKKVVHHESRSGGGHGGGFGGGGGFSGGGGSHGSHGF